MVIGAGYTGMWTAWHAKRLEPDSRIVVLEADLAAHGPSGRNGGFCNTMWHALPRMRDQFGDEYALAVGRAAARSVDEIGEFCERHDVDAWFRKSGYLQVSTAEAHDPAAAEVIEACSELGVADVVRGLDAAEVAERCRSPRFRAAAFFPGAATVQPARLAFGLRRRMIEAGVEFYERTPAQLRAGGGGVVEARSPGGSVRAPVAVLAAGAGAPGRPARFTVASSHIVLTEPVPDVLEQIGWTGGECITDSRRLIHYFRTTPDGRIAYGWGGGRIGLGGRVKGRIEHDPGVIERIVTSLRETFPELDGRRIERAWGGPIDASPSHLPVIHDDGGNGVRGGAGRTVTAFGYSGNGVAPSQMVGRSLASLALGLDDEPARLPLVRRSPQRVPPEPFRWLGGNAIRSALDRTERAELEGRRPGVVSRTLAAIPRRIGFHIGR